MANPTGATPRQVFVAQVHEALQHLYEPAILEAGPLFMLLGREFGNDVGQIRAVLFDAIERLKPEAQITRDTKPWRPYQVLFHRYVEQFSQYQVAHALALSERQIRREEKHALCLLADLLWKDYAAEHQLATEPAQVTPLDDIPAYHPVAGKPEHSHDGEFAWVAQSLSSEAIELAPMLNAVIGVTMPLAEALGVSLCCVHTDGLPSVVAEKMSLRQALINTLSTVIRATPAGKVTIRSEVIKSVATRAEATSGQLVVHIQTFQAAGAQLSPDEAIMVDSTIDLATAQRLFALSSIQVEICNKAPTTIPASDRDLHSWEVRLICPTVSQVAVLAIDDNADTLQLYHRYLTGTSHTLTTLCDPQQVLKVVEQTEFAIVILDVMLPGVDGWEMLQRMREHPRLQDVPIVVCSILPEERLALMLGASAFIRKPVNRADFLAVLARQLSQQQTDG